ncbi:Pupal cuticle protein C1B, putative [Pediculus humanus corporis]|uniref:Pupal cuticle protein C1B, putative n=1 Tax=Pediculus humanus subsp. corporis TaxID=121224 RepID=E0VYB3_PEDHC|nr:Pupal cuticle protein C1B, putative [Pediculus humanus corporis]EEB18369.1 Pupal cuticle protein C1B, putative [Pediculus humanus corporis]
MNKCDVSTDLKQDSIHNNSLSKMTFRFAVLAAVLAIANAGYLSAPIAAHATYAAPVASVAYAAPHAYTTHTVSPALVSQHANVLRTPGNLGQVSTYSKSINTPFSSVTKHDVRVSNDALAYTHAPIAYAHAPAAAYAAPIAKVAAAPFTYAAPAAYAAPIAKVAAAPVAYAAPAAVAKIGVAYSAAPAVAHMAYSNGYGIQYNW